MPPGLFARVLASLLLIAASCSSGSDMPSIKKSSIVIGLLALTMMVATVLEFARRLELQRVSRH